MNHLLKLIGAVCGVWFILILCSSALVARLPGVQEEVESRPPKVNRPFPDIPPLDLKNIGQPMEKPLPAPRDSRRADFGGVSESDEAGERDE